MFRQLLYHLYLPVDVPLLHVAEAPGLDGVPGAGVHSDQTVVSDADQLLPLPTLEPARRTQNTIKLKIKTVNQIIKKTKTKQDDTRRDGEMRRLLKI